VKPYPKYRDSGIEWLGEVPKEWIVIRSDSVTDYVRNQINPEDIKSDTVFHYSIPIVQETGTGQLEPTEDLGSAKQLITKKTILVSKLNPRKATICIAEPQDEVTICSSEFVAIKATKCVLEYLYYLVSSEMNRQRLDARVQSVTRSHQRVYPSDIYRFWLALPSQDEQQAIVAFLDRETSRIDALIQKKERMIELLKEKRIALITQTVTKGLDPCVPMKDSGIEWLGKVPEHWGKKRIKDLLLPKKGAIKTGPFGSQLLSSEMDDSDVKVYNQKSVITKDFESGENYISFKKLETLKEFQTYPGDFLITTRGTIGRCAILPPDSETGILHPCLMRLQTNKEIVDDRFLELLIEESQVVIEQLKLKSNGTTIEVIYQDSLKNVTVFLPPIHEQLSIAAYLDMKTNKTDLLIYQIETSISLLREYRASLIHHAVTGKIDLRGYDAQAQ